MQPKFPISILLTIGLLLFALNGLAKVDKWTVKANMPTERAYLSTSAVNGKIYAIGGINFVNGGNKGMSVILQAVEEYNPESDSWRKKADMPTARYDLSSVVVNNQIYAIGGLDSISPCPNVEEYSPILGRWIRKADMLTKRFDFAAAVVKRRIFAIGGRTSPFGEPVSVVEEYDPKNDRWVKRTDMPTPRSSLVAAVVKNKIYCIGGRNGDNIYSTVEEYDPELGKWTRKADMPTPRYNLSAAVVNGRIYCVGGNRNAVTEEYDPATDEWAQKSDMMAVRNDLSASSVNGKIYAIGGYDSIGFFLPTTEEYDTGFTGLNVDAKDKLATSWGKIKNE